MTITHPTASRNHLADAHDDYTNTGGGTAKFRIKEGGITLIEFNLANPAYGAAAGGTITLASTPIAAVASGSGEADNYEIVNRAGDIAHQGSVSLISGGGDIEVDNTNIVAGQNCAMNSFTYSAPV